MARSVEILREDLQEHSAVRAWSAIAPNRVEPQTIAVIKPWNWQYKSGVYRLAGFGPDGSSVIAKRCPLQTAALERRMYEEFLPRLSLPTLDYYGSVDEPDGQSCWIFLEDAGGDIYSPENPQHRALAARWLAAVHNAGRGEGWGTRLPDRSPEQYLRVLRICLAKVREDFGNPHLSPDGAAVLQTVSACCALLEARWGEVEAVCQSVPFTLVHGDFVKKNLRVRQSAAGSALLVFDWEFAGWGSPGTGLTQFTCGMASPDLAVYRSCVEDWPAGEDDVQVQRLALCGRFFRLVDSISWIWQDLRVERPEWLNDRLRELRVYSQRMAQALSDAGWTTH